jgi:hypothetical protein
MQQYVRTILRQHTGVADAQGGQQQRSGYEATFHYSL